MKLGFQPANVSIALIAFLFALAPAAFAGTGTITQGSCYLTSADKKVNLATISRGLVVTILEEGAEGRFKVQVPMSDPKVKVAAGWKSTDLPEGTGWVSKLFIKVDAGTGTGTGTATGTGTGTEPGPVASASPAAPPAPKKKGILGLLGIGSDSRGEETAVVPATSVDGTTTGSGRGAAAEDKGKPKAKAGNVRSLLAESKKGKTIILVNIPAQRLWVYKNGAHVLTANCRVGEKDHTDNKEGDNSRTRVGEHRLTSWHEKYSNSTYAPWTGALFEASLKQTGAFGAHTAKFNDRVGQYVHGTYGSGIVDWAVVNLTWIIPGSHGCVRVRNNDITSIRDVAPIGSQVVKVYALREGTQDAPPSSATYSNIYGYSDVAENGFFDPAKGELVGYRHPSDAVK